MSRRGVLFLVVGPSGVGKDSLIGGARQQLVGDPRFVFPRRVITRPPDPDGEDHDAVDDAAFDRVLAADGFALTWRAHGLRYGVPAGTADALGSGLSVVVNVSRSVVDEARQRFAPVRVLQVKAARDALRARLRARGREDDAGIERRIERAEAFVIGGEDLRVVVNDGPLESAIRAFVGVLQEELMIGLSEP